MGDCIFCNTPMQRRRCNTSLAYVRYDDHPVTEGHSLVISQRHVSSWFDLRADEQAGVWALVDRVVEQIRAADPTAHGFNIGFNVGAVAGQTIPHVHVHVIPRREGDTDDPRGGVRGVIPDRQKY